MAVTVSDILAGPFTPNSVTTDFPFTFKIPSAAEVRVFAVVADVEVNISSALYSVSIASDTEGGTVTFATAPATSSGDIYIELQPSFEQGSTFNNNGFLPRTLNPVIDRLAVGSLWLRDRLSRGLTVPRFFSSLLGKFPSLDAEGNWVWLSGTGNDAALRADIAAGIGGNLVGATGPYANEVARSARAAVTGPEYVDARRWGVLGNNGSQDEAALQLAFDRAPLGCTLVLPNGPIKRGTGAWNLTRWMNLQFHRGTDLRGDKNGGDGTAVLSINLVEDLANGISEQRRLCINGNGGRIYCNPLSGGAYGAGSYALTLGDRYGDTGHAAIIETDVRNVGFIGGQSAAIWVAGGNPFAASPHDVEPQTLFARFHECSIFGGVLDTCSDGTLYRDCLSGGTNHTGFTFDKVKGAFLSRVQGGTINNRKGAIDIYNGDFIQVDQVQMEHGIDQGDNTQTLGAMIIVRGIDRPVSGFKLTRNNLGAGGHVGHTVALLNAVGTVIDMNQQFTSGLAGGYSDLYLGDDCRYTHLSRHTLWGNRSPVGFGLITDPSRRMIVVPQSDPHPNPQFGLWLPIHNSMTFYSTWVAGAQGIDAFLDSTGGVCRLRGKLEAGAVGADVCAFPLWLAPMANTKLPLVSNGGVTVRDLTSSGVAVPAGANLPDANIWLDTLSWPINTDFDYYEGIL